MKVKVLRRRPEDYVRESKHDIHKLNRNYKYGGRGGDGVCNNILTFEYCSPELHPFEAEREYQRALNAVKLERVFAKPFLGSLDGHRDGLTCLAKHPKVDLKCGGGSGGA